MMHLFKSQSKIDARELTAFMNRFAKFKSQINNFLLDFTNKEGERVIRETKMRTPYDTHTLQNAWERSDAMQSGNRFYVKINNPTEYATDVEYGHLIMGGKNHDKPIGFKNGEYMLKRAEDNVQFALPSRFYSGLADIVERYKLGNMTWSSFMGGAFGK